jgi:hypothetical protein
MNVAPWLEYTDDELARRDIAETNLAVAQDLPGADDLDVARCLETLDRWTDQVGRYVQRSLPYFYRDPAEFWNSEAKFRILCMVTALQRDLGVGYNPDFIEGPCDASDSRTHFIHGPLTGFGGTCVNLPVLFVAVGRRLGYPLKLVAAKDHLFVRWRGDEVFNIEAAGVGFEPWPDEHYTGPPRPLSPAELASGEYMRDFTPRQELANFLCERGNVALDNLWTVEAVDAFWAATQLDQRYEDDWARATMVARILANMHGPAPETEVLLADSIARASPEPREQWDRLHIAAAQEDLQRILWRRALADRVSAACF